MKRALFCRWIVLLAILLPPTLWLAIEPEVFGIRILGWIENPPNIRNFWESSILSVAPAGVLAIIAVSFLLYFAAYVVTFTLCVRRRKYRLWALAPFLTPIAAILFALRSEARSRTGALLFLAVPLVWFGGGRIALALETERQIATRQRFFDLLFERIDLEWLHGTMPAASDNVWEHPAFRGLRHKQIPDWSRASSAPESVAIREFLGVVKPNLSIRTATPMDPTKRDLAEPEIPRALRLLLAIAVHFEAAQEEPEPSSWLEAAQTIQRIEATHASAIDSLKEGLARPVAAYPHSFDALWSRSWSGLGDIRTIHQYFQAAAMSAANLEDSEQTLRYVDLALRVTEIDRHPNIHSALRRRWHIERFIEFMNTLLDIRILGLDELKGLEAKLNWGDLRQFAAECARAERCLMELTTEDAYRSADHLDWYAWAFRRYYGLPVDGEDPLQKYGMGSGPQRMTSQAMWSRLGKRMIGASITPLCRATFKRLHAEEIVANTEILESVDKWARRQHGYGDGWAHRNLSDQSHRTNYFIGDEEGPIGENQRSYGNPMSPSNETRKTADHMTQFSRLMAYTELRVETLILRLQLEQSFQRYGAYPISLAALSREQSRPIFDGKSLGVIVHYTPTDAHQYALNVENPDTNKIILEATSPKPIPEFPDYVSPQERSAYPRYSYPP